MGREQKTGADGVLMRWISWLKHGQKASENTLDAYQRDCISFLSFLKKHLNKEKISIGDLMAVDFQELRSWLADTKTSATSKLRFLSSVRSLYKYIQKFYGLANHAPQSLSVRSSKSRLPKAATEQDVFAFLERMPQLTWSEKRDYAVVLLLYGCGLRISEALSIKISDFNEGFIRICGKGNKERILPVLPKIKAAIENYKSACPHELSDFLFLGERGRKLSRTLMAKKINILRNSLFLDTGITAHTFRHSCASHLLENGVDIKVIQELLGHSDMSSTAIYTQLDTRTLEKFYKRHPRNQNE